MTESADRRVTAGVRDTAVNRAAPPQRDGGAADDSRGAAPAFTASEVPAGGSEQGDPPAESPEQGVEEGHAPPAGEERERAQPPEGQGGHAAAGEQVAEVELRAPCPEDMRALGRQLAEFLRPGDLVLLAGGLGAGKTTLVQGIGAGLGVRGTVTSPTFVIARVHPAAPGGLPMIHADAYRLSEFAELDDLDLDTPAEEAVTVVEWGEGLAEDLAEERLDVTIRVGSGEERLVHLSGRGRRWDIRVLFS